MEGQLEMKELRYKSEFDKSFLLVEVEEESNYKRKMILQNVIPGFLPCKMIYEENTPCISYDVTAKKSLAKKFESSQMKALDLEKLFASMMQAVQKSREYLLESQNVCVDPEKIFFDIETDEIYLLYHPDISYERGTQYRLLSEFLLDKVDHHDLHGVKIAYQFYKLSKEDFFSLEVFQGLVEKERSLEERQNKRDEKIKIQNKEDSFVGNMEKFPLMEEREILKTDLAENSKEKLKKARRLNLFSFRKRNKEKEVEEEIRLAESTSIDEYFGNEIDEETVFFDDHYKFKWKEKRFSKEYELSSFPLYVGKLKGSVQIYMEDASVSRFHAKIREENGRILLQDLDSTNGSFLNGRKLYTGEEVEIQREDEIQFGKIVVNVV